MRISCNGRNACGRLAATSTPTAGITKAKEEGRNRGCSEGAGKRSGSDNQSPSKEYQGETCADAAEEKCPRIGVPARHQRNLGDTPPITERYQQRSRPAKCVVSFGHQ